MNMKPLLVVTALVGAVVFGPALLSSRVAAGDLRKEIPAAVADPANPAKSEIAVRPEAASGVSRVCSSTSKA
jgi:hypothetical protein